jgi:signal transduction histidine kinase
MNTEKQNIRNKIILENFSRMKYLSLIFIIYAGFALIIDFAPVHVWNENYLDIYKTLDISFSVFSICNLSVFWFYKKDNYDLKNFFIKATFLFLLVWSAVITGIELTSLGFSTLILIMLVAVFFIYINLATSLLFFLGAFVSLIATIYAQNQLNISVLPTLAIIFPISVISILISRKNFISKTNELINSDILIELNNQLNDITEHLEEEVEKRTNELSIAKEKAEESDRLKSAFLANMSHEIRTPMNGILGFASLLNEPDLTGEEQSEYIKMIEKGGERMLNIINNLIDISKIESGMTELVITETDINKQLDYIFTFFKSEVERKGMQLILSAKLPEEYAYIKTDREKTYAILTNLVKNAIKYCDQGFIDISCRIITSTSSDNHQEKEPYKLEFCVRDSGIGIAKERQKAIFERFVQADIEDIRAKQGAGLGLSISKAYVEMMGGKIWVESEMEKGSAFFFTIPYIINASKQALNETELPLIEHNLQTKKLNILIAEDEEHSERFLTLAINSFAQKIQRAKTGAESIEICRNNPDINLILMDIRMPDMNGYEATRQIRKFNKKVIIIAQTAYALSGDKEKAIAAGCNDYITKPIDRNSLIEVLSLHLNVK